MWPNPQFLPDWVTFTKEILNQTLHFFCSVSIWCNWCFMVGTLLKLIELNWTYSELQYCYSNISFFFGVRFGFAGFKKRKQINCLAMKKIDLLKLVVSCLYIVSRETDWFDHCHVRGITFSYFSLLFFLLKTNFWNQLLEVLFQRLKIWAHFVI